jgi:hypothetical protein
MYLLPKFAYFYLPQGETSTKDAKLCLTSVQDNCNGNGNSPNSTFTIFTTDGVKTVKLWMLLDETSQQRQT